MNISVPYLSLMALEVLLALCVVALVLLHPPKGDGLGAIGAPATMFTGKRGAEAGLDKVTWVCVGLFMFVCLLLGFGFVTP